MNIIYPDKSKTTRAELRDGEKLITKLTSAIGSDSGTAFFVVDPRGKTRLMTSPKKLPTALRLAAYKACRDVLTLPVHFHFYKHESTYTGNTMLTLSFDEHRYGFSAQSDPLDENRINVRKSTHFGSTMDELVRLFDTSLVTRSVRQFFKKKEEERHV